MIEDPDNTGGNPNEADAGNTDSAATATPPVEGATDATDTQGQGDNADDAAATEEGKTDDTQEGGKADEPEAVEGAPESYGAFEVPEGFVLEGERLEQVQTFARKNDWTQAQAQDAVNEFAQAWAQNEKALEAQNAQRIEQWGIDCKAELGDKFEETMALARTTVQNLENPKLSEAFLTLGWGNHPELVKAFAYFGKLSRDSAIDGLGNEGHIKPPAAHLAHRMYPNDAPKT